MKIRNLNPATVIATIALLFALSGTAVAAGMVTGANILNGSIAEHRRDERDAPHGRRQERHAAPRGLQGEEASRRDRRATRARKARPARRVPQVPPVPQGSRGRPGSARSRS